MADHYSPVITTYVGNPAAISVPDFVSPQFIASLGVVFRAGLGLWLCPAVAKLLHLRSSTFALSYGGQVPRSAMAGPTKSNTLSI